MPPVRAASMLNAAGSAVATPTDPATIGAGVADNLATLWGDVTNVGPLALGSFLAKAFRVDTADECPESLQSILPALVAPLSLSLAELRERMDSFFARVPPAGATITDLLNSASIFPCLMVVSAAAAFEVARRRSRLPLTETGLPFESPPGVLPFGSEADNGC
jgi:hypothetical protein